MKRKNKLHRGLLSPQLIVLGLSIILILFSLYCTHHIRPYDSDDVSWQTILLSWRPSHGNTVYLGGSDNYILRVPFFALLGHFFSPSRRLLYIEAASLAIINFVLFYIASLYFIKKLKIKLTYYNLLPFLWLASFGYYFTQMFLNTNLRSFEIGLSFVAFMLVAKVYFGELNPLKTWLSKIVTIVLTFIASALVFNDPYFLYFTLAPIAIFFIFTYILKKVNRSQLLSILGVVLFSFIFAKLIGHLILKLGITIPANEPLQFVSFSGLFNNISLALHSILIIFGADFFGLKVTSFLAVSAVFNLSLLVAIFYFIKRLNLYNKYRESRDSLSPSDLWMAFFGLLGIFVAIVYVASSLDFDINTYRYFIMMVFAFILFMVLFIGTRKKSNLLMLVLLLSIVMNIGVSVVNAKGKNVNLPLTNQTNKANAENYTIINAVEKLDLTKGYGSYWDGDINTYLSGNKVQFLPVSCNNGQTEPFYWLINSRLFAQSASRSFYIIDPDFANPPTCSENQAIQQFGKPAFTLNVYDKKILVYNYDLQSKMQ